MINTGQLPPKIGPWTTPPGGRILTCTIIIYPWLQYLLLYPVVVLLFLSPDFLPQVSAHITTRKAQVQVNELASARKSSTCYAYPQAKELGWRAHEILCHRTTHQVMQLKVKQGKISQKDRPAQKAMTTSRERPTVATKWEREIWCHVNAVLVVFN